MSAREALREAYERGLDLVEVAPTASPPVCRIMDYGKYRYEQKKRARESKKHQHVIVVKELKLRPKIDKHDFEYKLQHMREFLQEGHKVKVTIMFRGREVMHPEFGTELLQRLMEGAKDLIAVNEVDLSRVRLEGRNMTVIFSPSKEALKAAGAQSSGT
jgi:translation initiation factor IF-3